MENDSIFVVYGKEKRSCKLKHVTKEFIKDAFSLDSEPKTFRIRTEHGPDEVVPIDKEELSPGTTYHLPYPIGQTPATVNQPPNVWNEEGLSYKLHNAITCSKASYEEDPDKCREYLEGNKENHGFSKMTKNVRGNIHFIMAEVENNKQLYIGIRGTESGEEWIDNWDESLTKSNDINPDIFPGKIHSGFLKMALDFPLTRILQDERFEDYEIILCGHSLGGAIATVVAMAIMVKDLLGKVMMVDENLRTDVVKSAERNISCITFGSPLVGDKNMRKFLDSKNISRKFFNLILELDPIPFLPTSSECVTIVEKFGNLIPLLNAFLESASVLLPGQASAIKLIKNALKWIADYAKEGKDNNIHEFVPIGNFSVIDPNGRELLLQHWNRNEINETFSRKSKELIKNLSNAREDNFHHLIHRYEELVKESPQRANVFFSQDKRVEMVPRYCPEIKMAELVIDGDILRLNITGKKLVKLCVERMSVQLGMLLWRELNQGKI